MGHNQPARSGIDLRAGVTVRHRKIARVGVIVNAHLNRNPYRIAVLLKRDGGRGHIVYWKVKDIEPA